MPHIKDPNWIHNWVNQPPLPQPILGMSIKKHWGLTEKGIISYTVGKEADYNVKTGKLRDIFHELCVGIKSNESVGNEDLHKLEERCETLFQAAEKKPLKWGFLSKIARALPLFLARRELISLKEAIHTNSNWNRASEESFEFPYGHLDADDLSTSEYHTPSSSTTELPAQNVEEAADQFRRHLQAGLLGTSLFSEQFGPLDSSDLEDDLKALSKVPNETQLKAMEVKGEAYKKLATAHREQRARYQDQIVMDVKALVHKVGQTADRCNGMIIEDLRKLEANLQFLKKRSKLSEVQVEEFHQKIKDLRKRTADTHKQSQVSAYEVSKDVPVELLHRYTEKIDVLLDLQRNWDLLAKDIQSEAKNLHQFK